MTSARMAQAVRETGINHRELTDNARAVLQRRYLGKDREGNVLEDPEGMFLRVAKNLSQAELEYGASEEERQAAEDEFNGVMSRLEFLPNSPTLMNAGRELQQLSACFVLPVEDSLDSIFDTVRKTALIHKSGGGTGFSFSKLRPKGDVVGSTGGVASGPVSFITAFDAATEVVKQGSTRRGANMAILNVDHPDILEFIRVKRDPEKLVNFNISVGATKEFMERVREREYYDLINPRSGEITGQLNAREVFDEIVESAWATGDPGLIFLDRINEDNPNPQLGEIESTNPCGEQMLLPHESCNLGSVNLARMVRYEGGMPEVDWERLARVIRTGVRMLDDVIEMNTFPIPEIEEMNRRTRRIGLGVMGWADLLVQLGVRYDSDEALDMAGRVMKFIQDKTHEASGELAEERGAFPEWKNSIYKQPMRNSAPVTIAPTGTISIIAGASSGVEPLFALSYVRNVMDGTRLVETNPYFEAVARQEGFHSAELMERLARTGSLEGMDEAPAWVRDVFRVSRDISPRWHVLMQTAFQAHTDNAVSKTINMPASATREDVGDAYTLAYMTNCKGITIYRDGSKERQVLSTGADRESGDGREMTRTSRDRPRTMTGLTERFRTGHGNMYVTLNFGESGKPFEIFTNLGKAGGCDSAQLEAVSRLASMALRSGVDPAEIIHNLQGITCCPAWDDGTQIRSAPDAMAHMLKRHYSGSGEEDGSGGNGSAGEETRREDVGYGRLRCPDCNARVEFREGCETCTGPACGWNRCS